MLIFPYHQIILIVGNCGGKLLFRAIVINKFCYIVRLPMGCIMLYLSMKQGSMVCCFFGHTKISETMVFHASFLVSSEIFQWIGVHRLGLSLFGATVWNLLIIEPFFEENWIKLKPKTMLKFGGVLGDVGKPSMSQI
jgi:hypothetical protein